MLHLIIISSTFSLLLLLFSFLVVIFRFARTIMHAACTESKRGRTHPLGGQAHYCQCKFYVSPLHFNILSALGYRLVVRVLKKVSPLVLFVMQHPPTNWRIWQSPPSFGILLRQMRERNPMDLQKIPSGAFAHSDLCYHSSAWCSSRSRRSLVCV